MITYLINTILCAAAMILIYFLILEREKMHRFNRFYLLFGIVFSMTVSFITIKTPSPLVTVNELIAPTGLINLAENPGGPDPLSHRDNAKEASGSNITTAETKQAQSTVPVKQEFPWFKLIAGIYISVSAFLLLRFIRNLAVLLFTAIKNKKVSYQGATLVLTNANALPHSFLNYIFIDKQKFEQGTIEKEILQHELTHVNQRHSVDILLVELLMVFAWINPLFFLFRKAIMLNHEYLADESVLNTFKNTESYRLLLFNAVSQSNNLVLSSPFNYLTTKKRLIMMTKNTSRKVAMLKQIALIPLIATIGFLLSSRAIAQDKPKKEAPKASVVFSAPRVLSDTGGNPDAPQSVLDEFQSIISAYKIDTSIMRTHHVTPQSTKEEIKEYGRLTHLDTLKVKKQDKERLANLFFKMSNKQQNQQIAQFFVRPTLKSKRVPTKAQLESWKDDKTYGIWINTRRVKNSALNSHTNTDFSDYALRKLDQKTAKLMKYQIEVGLTTNEPFEKMQKQIAESLKSRPDEKYDMVLNISPMFTRNSAKPSKK